MAQNSKLACIVAIITVIVAIYTKIPSADVRFFCSHDKVFIEFEDNGKVWGTMWIDDDGKPQTCNSKQKVFTRSNSITKDI
jgi:hypothetical protein